MNQKPIAIDPIQLVTAIHGKSVKMTGFMADHATASWRQSELTFTSVHDRNDVVMRFKNQSRQRQRVLRKVALIGSLVAGMVIGAAGWHWVSSELGLHGQALVIPTPKN